MSDTEQRTKAPEEAHGAGGRRKRWTSPRVIVSEIEDDTEAGVANLAEANGGFLS